VLGLYSRREGRHCGQNALTQGMVQRFFFARKKALDKISCASSLLDPFPRQSAATDSAAFFNAAIAGREALQEFY